MAARFWVGGTASWDGTAGTKWATTSGGAGGASVPTSVDDVYFDANSTGTVTIAAGNTGAKSIDCTGFTGTITHTAGVGITVAGSVTLAAGMAFNPSSGAFRFTGTGTLTTFGKAFSAVTVDGVGITLTLGDALNSVNRIITITSGSFDTANYSVTASELVSNNSNTRTINLGSSTVTLSGPSLSWNTSTSTNLTLNAGTSHIVLTSTSGGLYHGGNVNLPGTFFDLSFTSNTINTAVISGTLTFNNVLVTGRASAGISTLRIDANQTINGTLTLSAGTNATMRTFVRSNVIGETRTLTCTNVASLTDIDFRDITIAGAAAPVSGTRLGDCKGNSGITFDAAKTVYWRGTGSTWGATAWSATEGGALDATQMPLAQDTAVFPSGYPASGANVNINASYNIGTIDMSARTSNTMTLTCSQSPSIYGNWINGTGTTLSGTGVLTFAGRGSQTITSAGRTFTQSFVIDSPGGSVTLQDAFTTNRSIAIALQVVRGTFDANGYNVSLTGALAGVNSANFNTRTIAVGSGTWTIAGSGTPWNINGSAPVITGTGTLSFTSASAKTFAGGNIQTYPTINQGGTGTLTITDSNKFAGITNTAIGRVQFTGGTTNEFSSFTISGALGNLLQLGSTNTTQAILIKPSTWNMGVLSTDAGNNTGLNFLSNDGTMEYLSVSYINGQVSAAPSSNIYFGSTNVTAIYYGSTPVTAIYYGSTQVF